MVTLFPHRSLDMNQFIGPIPLLISNLSNLTELYGSQIDKCNSHVKLLQKSPKESIEWRYPFIHWKLNQFNGPVYPYGLLNKWPISNVTHGSFKVTA